MSRAAYAVRALLIASALALAWLFISALLNAPAAHAAEVAPVSAGILQGGEPDAHAPIDSTVAALASPVVSVASQPGASRVVPVDPAPVLHELGNPPPDDLGSTVAASLPSRAAEAVADLTAAVTPVVASLAPAADTLVDRILPALHPVPAGASAAPGLALPAHSLDITDTGASQAPGSEDAGTGFEAGAPMAAPSRASVTASGSSPGGHAPQPPQPATSPASGGDSSSGSWSVVDDRETSPAVFVPTSAIDSVNPSAYLGENPPCTPD